MLLYTKKCKVCNNAQTYTVSDMFIETYDQYIAYHLYQPQYILCISYFSNDLINYQPEIGSSELVMEIHPYM